MGTKMTKTENEKVKVGLSLIQVIHMMKGLKQYTESGNGFNSHYEIFNHIQDYMKQFTVELMLSGINIIEIDEKIRQHGRKEMLKHDVEELAEMFIEHLMRKEKKEADSK